VINFLLHKAQNVQVSDTTNDAICASACYIKIIFFIIIYNLKNIFFVYKK